MARSFNANFLTEMSKVSPDGPAPYNTLELGFAAGTLLLTDGFETGASGSLTLPFVATGLEPTLGNSVAVHESTGDVYYSDDDEVYKQTGGSGAGVLVDTLSSSVAALAINQATGDVWAGTTTDIQLLQAGLESAGFVVISVRGVYVQGVAIHEATGDVYWGDYNGYIHYIAADDSSMTPVAFSNATRRWVGLCINQITGKIYAVASPAIYEGDVNDTSSGLALYLASATGSAIAGIGCDDTGNALYVSNLDITDAGVWVQDEIDDSAGFYKIEATSNSIWHMCVNQVTRDVWYVIQFGGDVYKATFGAIALGEGIVSDWSFIDSAVGYISKNSMLQIPPISDFTVTVINSGTIPFTDNITDADPIEGIEVTLYQCFAGLDYDTEKEVLFKGVVYSGIDYTETKCTIRVRGIWSLYDRLIGDNLILEKTSAVGYKSTDLDDIGKMSNILYGSLDGVPCLAAYAGAIDNLSAAMTAGQNTIVLVDNSTYQTVGSGKIDEEFISWTGKSGLTTLTGVSRGVGVSDPATHDIGAVVHEVASYFYYELASHAVKSIDDVYVDGFNIDRVITAYTGQTGSQSTNYGTKAIIRTPGSAGVTRADAKLLLQDNGMSSADATIVVDSIEGSANLTISDVVALFNSFNIDEGLHEHGTPEQIITWGFEQVTAANAYILVPEDAIDESFTTGAADDSTANEANASFGKAYYQDYPGDPAQFRVCIAVGTNIDGKTCQAIFGGVTAGTTGASVTIKSSWTDFDSSIGDTWEEVNLLTSTIRIFGAGANAARILQAWVEIRTSNISSEATGVVPLRPAGATMGINKNVTDETGGRVSRQGVANLNGNSVAEVEIGALMVVVCSGHLDDVSGTITGSSYALIELPDHVIKHGLITYCSFPSDDIGASFATSGAEYDNSSNPYLFAFVLRKPIRAGELFSQLAFQVRSRFFVAPYGIAQLIWRETNQSSSHAIPKSEIKYGSMKITRPPIEDQLITAITYRCDKDWSMLSGPDEDTYLISDRATSAVGITRYGVIEPQSPNLFNFWAIRDLAVATAVVTAWLSYVQQSRRHPVFEVFLDNMEIEPGDIVDITHPLDSMAGFVVEVISIRYILGSGEKKNIDRLELMTLQNANVT